MSDAVDKGGRPPTHGVWSLERAIEARRIDPALEAELVESARDMLADDGGTWERQPPRRRAIAERLAVLRLLLTTADTYLLTHGLIDGKGDVRGLLKAYTGLVNAFVRAAAQLGLTTRPEAGQTLAEYLQRRDTPTDSPTAQPGNTIAPASSLTLTEEV